MGCLWPSPLGSQVSEAQAGIVQRGQVGWVPHHRPLSKGPKMGQHPGNVYPLTWHHLSQTSPGKCVKSLSDAFQKESESVTLSNRKKHSLGAASGHRLPQLRSRWRTPHPGRWAASPSSPEGLQARLLPCCTEGSAATAGEGNLKTRCS